MNLFDTTTVVLEHAIVGAGQRQSVLGANIANANTPGYLRQDVDFQGALRQAMAGEADVERVAFAPTVDTQGVLRADGNGVDIDAEAARLAENALTHEALVGVAHARLDILRHAMGVR